MRPPLKVYFFGDSVCSGQGISLHRGWVARISERLESISNELAHPLLVVNSAVNGRTTRQALESMPFEIQNHSPEVLLVQYGMNDCNYWASDRGVPRVSPRAFSANLEEIVERARVFGASRVFLNTNHPTLRDRERMAPAGPTYEESNALYNELVREVAARLGDRVTLNDMARTFEERAPTRDQRAALLLPDGLHLSEAGHEIYYQALRPRIEEAVTRLARRA